MKVNQPELRQSPAQVHSFDSVAAAERVLSPEIESEYRLRLGRALRQVQTSRIVAQAHGWIGSVGMHIAQPGGLAAPGVVLAISSGNAELDRLAVSDIQAVLGKVALPMEAIGQAFRMSFVLDYRPAE